MTCGELNAFEALNAQFIALAHEIAEKSELPITTPVLEGLETDLNRLLNTLRALQSTVLAT